MFEKHIFYHSEWMKNRILSFVQAFICNMCSRTIVVQNESSLRLKFIYKITNLQLNYIEYKLEFIDKICLICQTWSLGFDYTQLKSWGRVKVIRVFSFKVAVEDCVDL